MAHGSSALTLCLVIHDPVGFLYLFVPCPAVQKKLRGIIVCTCSCKHAAALCCACWRPAFQVLVPYSIGCAPDSGALSALDWSSHKEGNSQSGGMRAASTLVMRGWS